MKKEQDYIRDITEIRSMMERSSKFLSLSGWAGIMAGMYALVAAYIVYVFYGFNPQTTTYSENRIADSVLIPVLVLALVLLVLSLSTAYFLSFKRSQRRGEKIWNATSRRMLKAMTVPLVAGGLLILVFISQGLIGLLVPMTLIFYGLSLFNAGHYTYREVKFLGAIEIVLGLLSTYFIEYSMLLWAIGFGLVHIVYGIYIHIKYER